MFPSLPSAANPYAGDAAGAASAGASIYNGLQSALNQQAQRQQQQANVQAAQAHQDQRDLFQALQDGWKPAGTITQDPTSALKVRTSVPGVDPGRIQTIGGQRLYKPTASEGLDDSNSFTLSDDLAAEAQKAGLTNIRAGTRYPKADMQTLDGRLAAWHKQNDPDAPVRQDINYGGVDAAGNPSAFAVDPTTLKTSPIQLPPGTSLREKPEKPPPAPKSLHFEPSTNGAGDVTMRGFDPETGELKSTSVAKGIGKGRDQDAAATRAEARATAAESKQQAGIDKAQGQVGVFQTKEQEQHNLRSAYGSILKQPNSESKEASGAKITVIDPVTRKEEFLTPARRAYYQDQYTKATSLADNYHQQATKLITRHGGDTGGASTSAPQSALSTGHKIGDAVPLKNGTTVKITKINPDGTFEAQ